MISSFPSFSSTDCFHKRNGGQRRREEKEKRKEKIGKEIKGGERRSGEKEQRKKWNERKNEEEKKTLKL